MFFNQLNNGHFVIRQRPELEFGLSLGQKVSHDLNRLLELFGLQGDTRRVIQPKY